MLHMKRILVTLLLLITCLNFNSVYVGANEEARIESSIKVLNDIMKIPEKSIPPQLLKNAAGLVIIPNVIKAGFVVGGKHGRGILVVRYEDETWSNPAFVELLAGSVGWQIGVQSTDVILIIKNQKSVSAIMKEKFTLGADASVAAGPVGRQVGAGTDVDFKAEIYSYSQSRGLFAGISLEGTSLKIDHEANDEFYNQKNISLDTIFSSVRLNYPTIVDQLKDKLLIYASQQIEDESSLEELRKDRLDRESETKPFKKDDPSLPSNCEKREQAAKDNLDRIWIMEREFTTLMDNVISQLKKEGYLIENVEIETNMDIKTLIERYRTLEDKNSGEIWYHVCSNYRQEVNFTAEGKLFNFSLVGSNYRSQVEKSSSPDFINDPKAIRLEQKMKSQLQEEKAKLPLKIIAKKLGSDREKGEVNLHQDRIRLDKNNQGSWLYDGGCELPPLDNPVFNRTDAVVGYIYSDEFFQTNKFEIYSAIMKMIKG